ncbi:MAG: TraB/GumN family protein [Nevskiaceae bacterium]|nr:MAG: TraB/GumN family protein [Nevskiaceae bacterium]
MKLLLATCALLLSLFTGAVLAAGDAPFLYDIQGPKAHHYLLGSVHLLPASAQPLPAALDAAYDKATAVIFESDLATLADPKTQMAMLNAAVAAQGLQAAVGKDTWERLQKRAKSLDLPLDQTCAPYKAWFCAMTLEVFGFEREGFDADHGLDQTYFDRALEDGKAIHWLEEPQAHLALFTQMPDKLGERFLIATLDEEAEAGQNPKALLRMWRENDNTELERLTREMKQRHPAIYARLLADRSRAWLPRLDQVLAADSPQLIIVGAAHLVGPDGLLALLRAKGYDVHAVGSEPAAKSPATP